jgi:hypothetical protein
MQYRNNLLLNLLCSPQTSETYSLKEWDMCIGMARNSGILARIYVLLSEIGGLEKLHPKVYEHLYSAYSIAAQNERIIRWEMFEIERALGQVGVRTILLKGAAYVMAGLPPARGRVSSDIDILVPFDKLDAVESALIDHGWVHMKLHPYDQRYFRKWMHELPPLQHKERRTVLDVHHTILPRTGRLHPNPELLFESARWIENSNLWILSPEDMVLHSAAHLFQDSELTGDLRNFLDLNDLFKYFGSHKNGFWALLISRGKTMNLSRPLFYALRYCSKMLGTQIPDLAMQESESAAPLKPVLKLMDELVNTALFPSELLPQTGKASLARWCLYARAHYLKMPPILLFYHLLQKAMRFSANQ